MMGLNLLSDVRIDVKDGDYGVEISGEGCRVVNAVVWCRSTRGGISAEDFPEMNLPITCVSCDNILIIVGTKSSVFELQTKTMWCGDRIICPCGSYQQAPPMKHSELLLYAMANTAE